MAFAAKVLTKENFIKNEIYIMKKLSLNDYIIRLFEIYEDPNELVLIFELMGRWRPLRKDQNLIFTNYFELKKN